MYVLISFSTHIDDSWSENIVASVDKEKLETRKLELEELYELHCAQWHLLHGKNGFYDTYALPCDLSGSWYAEREKAELVFRQSHGIPTNLNFFDMYVQYEIVELEVI